jgi:hypothetical protein
VVQAELLARAATNRQIRPEPLHVNAKWDPQHFSRRYKIFIEKMCATFPRADNHGAALGRSQQIPQPVLPGLRFKAARPVKRHQQLDPRPKWMQERSQGLTRRIVRMNHLDLAFVAIQRETAERSQIEQSPSC